MQMEKSRALNYNYSIMLDSKEFQKLLTKQGFKFMLSTKVTSATPKGSSVDVTVEDAKGGNAQKVRKENKIHVR